MPRNVLLLVLMLVFTAAFSQRFEWPAELPQTFNTSFERAYADQPQLPSGILEAVAYTRTHIRHVQPDRENASCLGLPGYYGPMGLVRNGEGWFRPNLIQVAALSEFQVEQIAGDPDANIRAFAQALTAGGPSLSESPLDWAEALLQLSELPEGSSPVKQFVLDSYLYSIFQNLQERAFQQAYQLPAYDLNLEGYFGSNNLRVLQASSIRMSRDAVHSTEGLIYEGRGADAEVRMAGPCFEFPGVLWAAADPSNYSSRSGTSISAVTIHTMQGYYAGSISWFQNPASNVSAHYNMRSSDGQITQMVCEVDKAWHVGSENAYTVGIEHEGFVSDASWYTNVVYETSAALSRDIAADHGILALRTYAKPGTTGVLTLGGCTRIKGHQHFPGASHTDPGQYWDWARYYRLVNNPVPTVTYSSNSGSFFDPGGASANYGDDQRQLYVIDPPGSGSVALNFSSFDLEANWDYLYVYDGNDVFAPLLGSWTGTSGPGAITSSGGAIAVEFRSDCATTSPGFAASWSSGGGTPTCSAPTGTWTGPIGWTSATVNWNPVADATTYQIAGRKIGGGWRTLITPYTAKWIGIFAEGSSYEWMVRASCPGAGYSAWSILNSFTTNTLRRGGVALSVSPNPAQEQILISQSSPGQVQIHNLAGHLVWQFNGEDPSPIELSIGDWPSGLYHVRWVHKEQVETGSFVKR